MKNQNFVKVTCLLTLTLQNAALAISMRYSRTRPGDMFISSTVVIITEIVKLTASLFFVYYYESTGIRNCFKVVFNTVVQQPLDTLIVCVPSMAYVLQNNLLYVSASHLDAATQQVTYQLKILTTAIFTVCMLRRKLCVRQWCALLLLVVGVALVQLSDVKENALVKSTDQNKMIGIVAALSACCISGFAGVFFEKILKGSDISVWLRNVQLSTLSIPAAVVHCAINDWNAVYNNGFFYGYDLFIAYLIFLQAFGGLVVALVVKYADNILKGFATSLAILCSCVFSMYFFDFRINSQFVCGASVVIASVFLYTKLPTTPPKSTISDKV